MTRRRPPAQIEIYRLDDRTPYFTAPAGWTWGWP